MPRPGTFALILWATVQPNFVNAQDSLPVGDAAAGEKAFRQCVACHVVKDPDGNILAGKNAKTGPNLYGIPGATAGGVEDFRYSKPLMAANAAGVVWTEEAFSAFVMDPNAYIRQATDDDKARTRMTFRVRKAEDAANLYAYLYSLANPQ